MIHNCVPATTTTDKCICVPSGMCHSRTLAGCPHRHHYNEQNVWTCDINGPTGDPQYDPTKQRCDQCGTINNSFPMMNMQDSVRMCNGCQHTFKPQITGHMLRNTEATFTPIKLR